MNNIHIFSKIKKYKFELITLCIYTITLMFVVSYHEPWFDEAQAWLIARDATIQQLFSSITHYEGHPPIWFIILMPFAKIGVPFEIGLKSVNCFFEVLAVALFVFKAPFVKLIRFTVPFTYFFFYQYGVVSRPYSLMLLGFVLSAMTYKEREEKPFRFAASLALICSSSAYGITLAAGISFVWLLESINKRITFNEIIEFAKSKKCYSLAALLVYNIILLILIVPFKDTYAATTDKGSLVINLLNMFLVAPADAACSYGYFGSNMQIYSSIAISCFIYFVTFALTGAFKKRSLFLIPWILFAIFGGIVYFGYHHLGIIVMFYMFLFWCCFDCQPELSLKMKKKPIIVKGGYVILAAMISISIYWSIAASFNDISLNYDAGFETAQFIKDNKLEGYNILVAWLTSKDETTGKMINYYNQILGISVLPYFSTNIFYNFNEKKNEECFDTHKVDKKGAFTNYIIDSENPDVLIGTDSTEYTFGPKIRLEDYTLIKTIKRYCIWKDKKIESTQLVFIRKDVLKKLKILRY